MGSSDSEDDMEVVLDTFAGAYLAEEEEENVGNVDGTSSSEDSSSDNNNQLVMPERKMKDPTPVWTCAD